MTSIYNHDYSIHFQEQSYIELNAHVAMQQPSSIFVLVDEHTMKHCYPYFIAQLETTARIEVIEIEAGELYKTIDTCVGVWSALVELGCDRNSLLLNLGGGVITDLGGFIGSTIKRGIPFIHVPTSLLAMVDAAVGGKNGVDLGNLKNQIGVTNTPIMTLVDAHYLKTLSQRELLNGSIEMFKHGLIADRAYWENMKQNTDYTTAGFADLIYQSVLIKNEIASSDPFENGARKALNYGHTIGHAIESYCMVHDTEPDLLHGEAVAAGILIESFLSTHLCGLPQEAYENIQVWYKTLNLKLHFSKEAITEMLELMTHDKKNKNGEIRFVLLERIGQFKTDATASEALIRTAFKELY
jgi:3-dehydroquinate synthase